MAKKYLDSDGLLYFWQKIKNLFAVKADAIKNITRSGTTFTATRADGTTFTFTQQDNTVSKTSTTPKMDGTAAIGSETNYAAGDHVHPSDTTKVDKVSGKGLSTNDYTTAEKNKLSGIEAGAEVNVVTAVAVSSSSGTPGLTSVNITHKSGSTFSAISTSSIGQANGGICPLNSSGKVDSSYLPSYVDDVIEAYARSGQTALSAGWLSTTSGGSALTPETGKIYVLMADSGDYAANSQFRWGGTAYVKLSDGGVSSITNAEIDTIVAS